MKKLLFSGLLTITLLSSVVLGARTTYALGNGTGDQNPSATQASTQTTAPSSGGGGLSAGAAKAQQEQAAENKPSSYTGSDGYSGISGWVMTQVMSLAAWLLGLAAITLDSTVYYTVVHMGAVVGGVNGLSAIGVAWRVLRDIGNILLIFGFVALGITTILQVDWYGSGMKMLPKLLLAAIFINFSLFVSQAAIDAGNIFATQFYTQINGGTQASPTPVGLSTLDAIQQEGISNKIMGQLGLQTMYGDVLTNPDILKGQNIWLVGAFGTILFLVAAFVFFSLAFVLVARFVILVLLIIVAPIGFAGLAVPKLTGLADRWWKMLFEQVITAPVLLLMLYVALAVITDAQFLRGFGGTDTNQSSAGWLGFIGNSDGNVSLASTAGMMLSFLVAMGLLLAVTMMSKQLSAFGAGTATKWGGKLSFGAAGFVGRRTIGRTSGVLARKVRSSRVLGRSFVGQYAANAFDYGAKSSFDIRGSGVLGKLPGGGIDAGAAQKGGYAAIDKAAKEGRVKYGESLKLNKDEQRLLDDAEGTIKRIRENPTWTKEQKDAAVKKVEEQEFTLKNGKKVKGINALRNYAQTNYADNTESWAPSKAKTLPGFALASMYAATAGPRAGLDAAKELRKKAKNSKSDKDFNEAMKRAVKEAQKGEEGGGDKKAA